MISIVIPALNEHELTQECITAVRTHTKDYEIILVDNGSNPPYGKPYTGFNESILIRNETNLGFPVAVNQGIQAAHGEIIVLLNNDCIVTPKWSERLMDHLEEYDIVGPLTNYASGEQATAIAPYDTQEELNQRASELTEENYGCSKGVKWIIGFCMMFRKSLYDTIGPFDESMWPCCGEEIDFCMKANEKGLKVGIALDTYVHHEGSKTFHNMYDVPEYNSLCNRNNDYLKERWGDNVLDQELTLVPIGGLKLNLGCGYKKLVGFVNIDIRPEVSPDIICNVIPGKEIEFTLNSESKGAHKTNGLPYEDNSVDYIRADNFLEHIPIGSVIPVIEEIWRVLKPGAVFESLTPSTDGRGAFQDPMHVSFWNRNSWFYYSDDDCRNLYGIKAKFDLSQVEDINGEMGIIFTRVIAKAVK